MLTGCEVVGESVLWPEALSLAVPLVLPVGVGLSL